MPPQSPQLESQFNPPPININPTGNVPTPEIPEKKKSGSSLYFTLAIVIIILASAFLLWRIIQISDNIYKTGNSIIIAPVNPIANWKTYTNTKYGYEFKYPSDWSTTTNANDNGNALFGIGATSTAGTGGVEYMGKLKASQSLKDFVTEFNKGVESGALSESTSTVNGQNMVISILPHAGIPQTESKSVAFENNNQVFNVYINYHSEIENYPEDKTNLDMFSKILSTFKFVSTSTPSVISTSTPNTSTSTNNQ